MQLPRVVLVAMLVAVPLFGACPKKGSSTGPVAPFPPDDKTATAPTPPAEPTPPPMTISDAELEQLMNDFVAFVGRVATAVDGARTDCPEMAGEIERVAGDHTELLARARTVSDDPAVEDRSSAWMKTHEAEVMPVFMRLVKGVETCNSDPAVMAAIEKLGSM